MIFYFEKNKDSEELSQFIHKTKFSEHHSHSEKTYFKMHGTFLKVRQTTQRQTVRNDFFTLKDIYMHTCAIF